VNTHGHSDHRGGNHYFADIAAHPAAEAALTSAVPPAQLAEYLVVAREQLGAYHAMKPLDDRFFHMFTGLTAPRPLPEDADRWTVPAGPRPAPLADRQRIDLGDRTLTVLFTPGHSPDSVCLLDEGRG